MLWLKICGLTRLEDAALACELGASALGFVFHSSSPRCANEAVVREIVRQTPPCVLKVGVFVKQSIPEINHLLTHCQLDRAQLHGNHTWQQTQTLVRPAWRVVSVVNRATIQRAIDAPDVLLHLDAPTQNTTMPGGGTGRAANWSMAAEVARRKAIILAGGLTHKNIAQAGREVNPFGFDVSSGVEKTPGIKDPLRMQKLFRAAARMANA